LKGSDFGIWKPLVAALIFISPILLVDISVDGYGINDYTGDHTKVFITTSGILSTSQPANARFTLDPYYDGEWRTFKLEGIIAKLNGTRNATLNLLIENKGEEGGYIDSMVSIDYGSDGTTETYFQFPQYLVNVINESTVEFQLSPETIEGDLLNVSQGDIYLMLRQEAKPKFTPVIHIGERSNLMLPYDRDYLIAQAPDDVVTKAGEEIRLVGNAYNPMDRDLSYRWDRDLSDGLNWDGWEQTIDLIYVTEGRYTVTLNISDGTQYSHDQMFISILASNAPVPDSGGNRTVYRNEQVWLDASGSFDIDGDPLTFKWIFPDGSEEQGIQIMKRFSEPGRIDVNLSVSDGFHISNTTFNIMVRNRAPVIDHIDYGIPRIGISMTFNASYVTDPEGDDLEGFFWDFGDGSYAQGRVVEHTFLESKNVRVILSVFDGYDNGTGHVEFWIPVNEAPVAKAKDEMIYTCTGKMAYFFSYGSEDPEGQDLNYTWDFGDGSNDTGWVSTHVYEETGIYDVTLTVRDIVGDMSTDELVVEVLDRGIYYPEEIWINSSFSGNHGVLTPITYFLFYYEESTGQTYQIPREDGGFRTYGINLSADKWYDVNFAVLEGGGADIFLMNEDQYYGYLNKYGDSVDWICYGSSLDADDWTYHLKGGDVMYIIIDNNDKIPGGSSPQGTILYNLTISVSDYRPPDENGETDVEDPVPRGSLCLIGLISAALLIVFMIPLYIFYYSIEKRRREIGGTNKQDIVIGGSRVHGAGSSITVPTRKAGSDVKSYERTYNFGPLPIEYRVTKRENTTITVDGPPSAVDASISERTGSEISALRDMSDEADFLGSTDLDALVYEDEKFDLKRKQMETGQGPNLITIEDGKDDDKDQGAEDDSDPRLAPPPPNW